MSDFQFDILEPAACRQLEPALPIDLWVYRYRDNSTGWLLSIATHGEPNSHKLSLGGFRIAPESRASQPGYNNDREAIGLAMGMEEKVFWSRLIGVGGPLGIRNLKRVVGGKCVLLPGKDARVGQPLDFALLDFAVSCLRHFEETSGVLITTGQDLGHGIMSDGQTPSLKYLNERFPGSILSDTSKPTAEGNFHTLRGGLRALSVKPDRSRIGLIGAGNIGLHLLHRLRDEGAECLVVESHPGRSEELRQAGIPVFHPADKGRFLAEPLDALALNANGGSLDTPTIAAICGNTRLRFISGCENLVMPDPAGNETLRQGGKIYTPTELCGMMGYLTAVEEYLCWREGSPYQMTDMFKAAEKLDEASFRATTRIMERDFACTFEEAMREVYA